MAAELVGGAFLSSFLQVLLDRMASRDVIDFIRGERLDRQLFQKLEATLLSVNALLDDAEGKQIVNHNVKKWVNELKDAVYDAEDLLDEVATEAEFQTSRTRVWNFISSLNPFHKRIESKLKDILERVEYLERQKDILSLREGFGEKYLRKLPTTSLGDESSVYGRADDKEAIMKLLLSDDSSSDGVGVVPIVGMGGIGKTTLAQIVYNDDSKLKQLFNFDLKIWVCVSENFDVFRVAKAILEAVTSSCEVGELNLLQVKLTECLMDCGSLNQLPNQMGRLTNLRHLDISGTLRLEEMPLQMSRLTNLQTLSAFVLGNLTGSSISELGELQQLRGTLSIFNLQNVVNPRDALEAKFKDKEYLDELILKWSDHTLDTSTERDVLSKLQPHTNLKRLSIECYGGTKFPDWLGDCSFSNIVSLRLSHCKYCFFLPPLGQLPSLKELFIIGFDAVERVGLEFYRNSLSTVKPFRCLKFYGLRGCWSGRNGFPLKKMLRKDISHVFKNFIYENVPS
ncbi:putative disease resistance RPP13-like protein 1 isoform X3 [Durio zibethinus]|uniref:Disease resistance RPP13-like protein 1 isoform X3 n=1 Tax=Durio zibethinus TaxID=66656 RepID=A0A6P5XRL8_DURZI|nr:putative disease resistance RPP13-like protein 1 isoform X3 [Durio zibethinus]